jgi:lipid-binding SYLF domain-containing protein
VARRKDGGWSAPIAVGGMSLSAGTAYYGVKLTDSVTLLMDPAEVQNFSGVGVILNQGVSVGATCGNQSGGISAGYQAGRNTASMAGGASVGSKSIGQQVSHHAQQATCNDDGGFMPTYTYSKTLGIHAGAAAFSGFMTVSQKDINS